MEKRYTYIANWKMYLSFESTLEATTKNFDMLVKLSENPKTKILLAPSLPAIYPLAQIFSSTKIGWCAQDCSEHFVGAFTGQVSPETIKFIGCSACIIGHSERRKHNGESDELIAKKAESLLDFNISPVVCIGENERDFLAGKTIDILERQLSVVLEAISKYQQKINKLPVFVAYEPIWSIGSGNIPNTAHLETVFSWLDAHTKKATPTIAWSLLYGGSVSSANAVFFKKNPYIDGFLIGKASLDFQEFEKIIKSIMVEE